MVILVLTTGACQQRGKTGNLAHLPASICGNWSTDSSILRCRIRLRSTHVSETDAIVAVLEIENKTTGSIALLPRDKDVLAETEPTLIWTVGAKIYFSQSDVPVPRQLAAGQSCVIGPVRLQLAPSLRAPSTLQAVSVSLDTGAQRIAAPAVSISITPATWGPMCGNLRACLSPQIESVRLGQSVHLSLYLYAGAERSWEFTAPDWDAPNIRSEDGLITLRYAPRSDRRMMSHTTGPIQRNELDVTKVFSHSGNYRMRVQFVGPGGCEILSNEIPLRIDASDQAQIGGAPLPIARVASNPS